MKITPANNLELVDFPLPIYESVHLADAISKKDEQFSIFVGLDKEMIAQLKKLSSDSNDIELQKNTSDMKRFSERPYEKWYRKNRTPFVMVHNDTSRLAAIIWFGPKPLGRKSDKHLSREELMQDETMFDNKNWHTISYRSYSGFRGKGLMKDFGNFVVGIYLKKFPNIKLWTSTNSENTAGTAYAKALGFKLNEEVSDRENDWLVMVRD